MQTHGSVSRQTLYIAVLSALIVGFIGGVGYSALRTASLTQTQQQAGVHNHNGAAARASITDLEQKAQADPDNAQVWAELGHAFFDSGQADNAVAAYTRALAIEPGNTNVRTDLGVMYFQSNKHREAIAEFDQVLSADPGHPQARFNKGVVLYSGLNDKAGALAEWNILLKSHPEAVTPTGMALKDLIRQVEEDKH